MATKRVRIAQSGNVRTRTNISSVNDKNSRVNANNSSLYPPLKCLNQSDHNASMNAYGNDRTGLKNQQIAMSRLARSKWRRDPIKERLLFLTGTGTAQVEYPDYVNYLEGILEDKHFEHESSVIKSLASLEVDREWLWRVKKEVDFSELEKESKEQERAARAAADAQSQDRQGMLLSAPKEMTFYTQAARTYGLDANRNVEKVKESHVKKMKENAESGKGYRRYTRLLDLKEEEVSSFQPLIDSEDIRQTYIKAEDIIQDTQTVEDQEEEEREREEEEKAQREQKE